MRKYILIFILLLFSSFVYGEKLTLTWNANSEPDLSHYIVYWGTTSRNYTFNSGNIGLVIMYTKEVIPPEDAETTYYFAVTAVDTSGLESDFSNEVFKTFDTRIPPAPPKNLNWFERVVAWIKTYWKFWS
jgi:fibronectin type 3 domain-containing protein